MHIRKRGKLWRVDVRYKGSRISKSFTMRGNATQWANKTLSKLETGTYQDTDRLFSIRLKDLLQLHYDHVKSNSRRLKNFTYDIESIRNSSIGRVSLAQLTPVKIANFKNELLKKKLSPTTVRKKLLLISRAITVGQKELGIPILNNPVKPVALPKERGHRDRIISNEEYQRLLVECGNSIIFYLKQIVELAYETLCRQGEILNLTMDDINLEERSVIIRVTKNAKPRRIGLSTRAVEIIKSLPINLDKRLFNSHSRSHIGKEYRKAVARAGIKDLTFHDLRHLGANNLAQKGWSTVELKAQGGWLSSDMVARYANIQVEHLAKKLRS